MPVLPTQPVVEEPSIARPGVFVPFDELAVALAPHADVEKFCSGDGMVWAGRCRPTVRIRRVRTKAPRFFIDEEVEVLPPKAPNVATVTCVPMTSNVIPS